MVLPSKNGHTRRHKGQPIKRYVVPSTGYYYVTLTDGIKAKHVQLHKVLAETFIEKPESNSRLCVNHKDGNKLNNSLDNLEWVTYAGNNQHAYRVLHRKGPNRKLTDDEVRMIRRSDKSSSQLARELRMNVSSICAVRKRKTYKEVA